MSARRAGGQAPNRPPAWSRALVLLGFGAEVGLAIWAGQALGGWGDERWGTAPWLRLTGVLAGVVLAGLQLWHMLRWLRRLEGEQVDDGG